MISRFRLYFRAIKYSKYKAESILGVGVNSPALFNTVRRRILDAYIRGFDDELKTKIGIQLPECIPQIIEAIQDAYCTGSKDCALTHLETRLPHYDPEPNAPFGTYYRDSSLNRTSNEGHETSRTS